MGKFAWGLKAKHCWELSQSFENKKYVDNSQQCFAFTIKQTFLPIIWIFTKGEGDAIESRLPFKIFSTFTKKNPNRYTWIFQPKSLKVRSLAPKGNQMKKKPLSHVFRFFYQISKFCRQTFYFSSFNLLDCFHFRFSNVKNSEKGNKCSTKCWNTKIKMWGETYIFHSSPSFSNSYLWILFSWLWALHLCEIKFII